MVFIGVDRHTNSFTVCRLEADGREEFATYQLAAVDLAQFCFGLDGGDEVAVEARGNSAWFYGEIRSCVGRIVVVNPKQFQVIRKSVKKTDRNGARALAFFLSKDMLPETCLKSVAESALSLIGSHARRVRQAAHAPFEQNPRPLYAPRRLLSGIGTIADFESADKLATYLAEKHNVNSIIYGQSS